MLPFLSAGAHGATDALLSLFLMYAAAKLAAELFTRLSQPPVVGEILAGVLIGPHALGWVAPGAESHLLAELGVIFLLFGVGLETRPSSILRVGGIAGLVAVLGVVVPMLGGWSTMAAFGAGNIESLFVAAAMVATSVGITARVLAGMGLLDSDAARIILGAAVIDDVLGLLVLAAVSGLAGGSFDPTALAVTALLSLAFVAAAALLGAPLLTRLAPHFERLQLDNAFFAIAVVLCFGLAVAAGAIGVAAIVGAFLAGMALAEAAEQRHELHAQIRGVTEFLVPFFLVNIGLQLDLSAFADPQTLWLSLALTVVAVLTKLIGCGLGMLRRGWRAAAQVGVGMVPRGEVGIVVAQMGLALGVIDTHLFAATLFMACATTLIAPPLIKPLFRPAT